VFVIPSRAEVENYFVRRQQDASRNSVNMLASCHYPHKELQHASIADRHDLLYENGINWNNCPADQKRGRVIRRRQTARLVSYVHKRTHERREEEITETSWELDCEIPMFTPDREYLAGLILDSGVINREVREIRTPLCHDRGSD
jgi:tRNA(His) 5'-end guanylyltransferase